MENDKIANMETLNAKVDLLTISITSISKGMESISNSIHFLRKDVLKDIDDLAAASARQFSEILNNLNENVVTKEDLSKFSETVATKEDFSSFSETVATKDDFSILSETVATKKDLTDLRSGLIEDLGSLFTSANESIIKVSERVAALERVKFA